MKKEVAMKKKIIIAVVVIVVFLALLVTGFILFTQPNIPPEPPLYQTTEIAEITEN